MKYNLVCHSLENMDKTQVELPVWSVMLILCIKKCIALMSHAASTIFWLRSFKNPSFSFFRPGSNRFKRTVLHLGVHMLWYVCLNLTKQYSGDAAKLLVKEKNLNIKIKNFKAKNKKFRNIGILYSYHM